MSINKEKTQLIEKVGLSFEEKMKLSPLASRIYSLLVLSSYDGLTFEEIRTVIQASKSSISVNINVLLQLNYINFHTKTGDRKRYFRLAKYSSLVSLQSNLQSIIKEKELLNEINTYNKKYHSEKYSNEISLGQLFENYLIKKQNLIEETIQEMESFRTNETIK